MRRLIGVWAACLQFGLLGLGAVDRPNFVWLISEDNSKHFLKLYDEMGAATPHIEALAQSGLVFEHAFSNAPVCSVARTTLMTACYGPRIGTQFHRRSVTVPMPEGVRMFPYWLRESGYYTTNNRKKDYNAQEGQGVWDESSARATWRKRADGQPFFHMQSFGVSHESSLHFSQEVQDSQATQTDPGSVSIPPYHPTTPTFRYAYARYHDRIQEVDRQIGAVVDALEADGLLDSTFIFYFGDHGGVLPGTKGYAKERGLHVPLVVRIPEKYRGQVPFELGARVNGFVSFIDFGPTLLNLAGLAQPDGIDGRPFLGAGIAPAALDRRDEAFGYADRFDEKYDLVRVLRKGRFSYVRSYQPFNFDGIQNNYRYIMLAYQEWRDLFEAGQLNEAQAAFFRPAPVEGLYDVERDPHEVDNLADRPEFASVLLDLRQRLSRQVKALPDLSFFPESALVAKAFGNPTGFGQEQQERIAGLVDTADLMLLPFADARAGIRAAIESTDPWRRYWGWIVCGHFGGKAAEFGAQAQEAARGDAERLVRVRAAEFLGLAALGDPRSVITEALYSSTSGVEACLIMNSIVLLEDGQPSYRFDVQEAKLSAAVRGDGNVKRRLLYLEGELRRDR